MSSQGSLEPLPTGTALNVFCPRIALLRVETLPAGAGTLGAAPLPPRAVPCGVRLTRAAPGASCASAPAPHPDPGPHPGLDPALGPHRHPDPDPGAAPGPNPAPSRDLGPDPVPGPNPGPVPVPAAPAGPERAPTAAEPRPRRVLANERRGLCPAANGSAAAAPPPPT